MPKLYGGTWISLKYLKKYPSSKRSMSWFNKIVAIECTNGYYRSRCAGYTYRPNAAAYTFSDALKSIWSDGPERNTIIHCHATITDENHNRSTKSRWNLTPIIKDPVG